MNYAKIEPESQLEKRVRIGSKVTVEKVSFSSNGIQIHAINALDFNRNSARLKKSDTTIIFCTKKEKDKKNRAKD